MVIAMPASNHGTADRWRGFTLIELLVVMTIVALLLSLALPRYLHSVDRSKETVLRHDLVALRDAIDKFLADTGRYPEALDDLAAKGYVRQIPVDPLTDSATTWILVPPPDGKSGVYDVRSGAPGKALDGSEFKDW
jgi:general secretion pathway protein G